MGNFDNQEGHIFLTSPSEGHSAGVGGTVVRVSHISLPCGAVAPGSIPAPLTACLFPLSSPSQQRHSMAQKMSLRRDYNHAPGIHLIIIEKYVYFEVNRPNTKLCNICNHNIQCQIILYSLLHKQHNSGVITFILEHYFQKQRDMPTKRLSIRKTSAQNYCCRNKNESLGEPTVASSIDEQYTVCHYEKSLLT